MIFNAQRYRRFIYAFSIKNPTTRLCWFLHRPASGSRVEGVSKDVYFKACTECENGPHLNFVDIEQTPDENDCYAEADCESNSEHLQVARW